MNAAHLARRFDRRLRRRPYRAVGDGVELPRDELRRIGASDGGVCLASDGQVAWVNHTTLLCPALRLELTLGALPSDAWQPLLLSLFNFGAWLRAVWFRFALFFFGWSR